MTEYRGFLPPKIPEIDQIRRGHHTIDLGVDISVTAQDKDGHPLTLSDFREDKTGDGNEILARAVYMPQEGEAVGSEVRMKSQINAVGETKLDVIERNKGKLVVAGSVVIALAAGAGLLIRRSRRS